MTLPPNTQAFPLPGWAADIEKGSALDFSSLLDGPAGKYGRLITASGHFVFENNPATPVRFYGANLSSGANFLDKDSCQRLADRLAACGYNSVRFHHHDRILTRSTGERATDLDPVEMDRLDYLFHCCKERGIYITTDLYVSRIPRQLFRELGRPAETYEEFKFLIHLLDEARENWEDFSRQFLNHVNPYTELSWKDDPALATLSFVNEDSIFHCYKNAGPDIRALYDRHFETWLAERNSTPASAENATALLNLFLFETCRDSFSRMRTFVRSLGCKTLITDQNHWSIIPMSLLRQPCDYVDDHFYWDHPETFQLPSKLLNTSCLTDPASIFSGIFPGRCFGKPYTISEFNWVYPNRFRAESGPLTAAYAALQDWDGLYRYSYAHSPAAALNGTGPSGYFDIATDPINSLSDRIGILLFLRGDVQSSALQIPFAVSSGHMHQASPVNTYPGQAWKLGFVGRIGTVVERDGKLDLPASATACIAADNEIRLDPGGASAPLIFSRNDSETTASLQKLCDFGHGKLDLQGGLICSSTGEIQIHEKAGTFQVSTPHSEVMVFNNKSRMESPFLTVDHAGDGGAVFSASSMDGLALENSRRILLIHLTDALHEDTRFNGNIVEHWGSSPHFIVSRARADLTFRFRQPEPATRVWALDLSGKRIREIIARSVDGYSLTFTADTLPEAGPCFLYEIIRQPDIFTNNT